MPDDDDYGLEAGEPARSEPEDADESDTEGIRFRVGDRSDRDLVGRCVYLALAWNPDRDIPNQATVLSHPEVTRYHAEWGRPGDVVVIAQGGEGPVGYAFARLFTHTDHGHGFVDETTPEMGVAIEPEYRGGGIGTGLLEHLHHELRLAGFTAVSLSVELDNRAKRLYERLGYVETAQRDGASIMVLAL